MGDAAFPRPQGGVGPAGAARLCEGFGSGPAAVISPMGTLRSNGRRPVINEGTAGERAHSFFDTITGSR